MDKKSLLRSDKNLDGWPEGAPSSAATKDK